MTATVLKRFDNQRHRGITSFGFYLPGMDRLTHHVREGRIKKLLGRTKGENSEILFHHRFATSTVDVRNACHPFSTKDHFEAQYIGVHNGVLWNEDKLQKQHEELGIKYVSTQPNGSFNDSEALVYDLARYFEGEVDELTAEGSIAFIVVKKDKSGKPLTLFFGRNSGNPLVMKHTKHSLTISSEGEGEELKMNTLYMYDYDTGEIRQRYMFIPTHQYHYTASSYTPKGYLNTGNRATRIPEVSATKEEDDYWDKRYKTDLSSKRIDIGEYQNLRNEEFVIRGGKKEEIRQQFLEENEGRLMGASMAAQLEWEDAITEMNLLDRLDLPADDEEGLEAVIEYWAQLDSHSEILKQVADELYKEAKDEFEAVADEEEEEEKQAERAFGFHSSRLKSSL